MDSSGRIYSPERIREMEHELYAAGTEQSRRDEVRRKLGAMVGLTDALVVALAALPRAQRRAWYSDYRRNIRKAKRAGVPAVVPEVPALGRRR